MRSLPTRKGTDRARKSQDSDLKGVQNSHEPLHALGRPPKRAADHLFAKGTERVALRLLEWTHISPYEEA